MRAPLTSDDLEQLEGAARTPKAHRTAAATLVGWAKDAVSGDEVTPADLLSAAGWHLDQAGDADAAIDLHRQAVAAPGTTTPDARCILFAALLDAGRTDEARQVADDLRRSGPRVIDMASMAEILEATGDLPQAHRWVAMGFSRVDLAVDTDEPADYEVEMLLEIRTRVREALGFPPDELDL